MSPSDGEWDWRFTDPAEREYEKLQPHEQERIVSKLDEIVNDQWRDPGDYSSKRAAERLAVPPHGAAVSTPCSASVNGMSISRPS